MSRFFGTKWPRVVLVAALAVAGASFLPKIPRDQSLRVELGNLGSHVRGITIRWAPNADRGENKVNSGARSANIEDWTGEATFRYENGAPRIIEQKIRAADGDYVVEIEVENEGGEHVTTTKEISLAGGSVTLDVADTDFPAAPVKDAAP